MSSMLLTPAIGSRESCSYISGSHLSLRKAFVGSELLRVTSGTLFDRRHQLSVGNPGRVVAFFRKKIQKKVNPQPIIRPEPNKEIDPLSYLSDFKPLNEKPKKIILPFEKPMIALRKRIASVQLEKMAKLSGKDFSKELEELEDKLKQLEKANYMSLTAYDRLMLARHPHRPTFLDYVMNMSDQWVELHGDRAGYDDPAIVTGLASIAGKTYMLIGQQKGRNTEENIRRNFAMPTPHGYRKALRMMKYAEHHRFGIISFVDTPGAFADLKAEAIGQGEAIAQNLRTMYGLTVPIVTVVLGEGGSGGALAIACSDKLLMMENSVYYIASPEAAASILFKTAKAAPTVSERLKIGAHELVKMKIADTVIPESIGGAHKDPVWTAQQVKEQILKEMEELCAMDVESLLAHRRMKFRYMGVNGYGEDKSINPRLMRRMMKQQVTDPKIILELKDDLENLEEEKEQVLQHLEEVKTKKAPLKKATIPITKSRRAKAAIPITKFRRAVTDLTKAIEHLKTGVNGDDFKEQLDALSEKIDEKLVKPLETIDEEMKKSSEYESSLLEPLEDSLRDIKVGPNVTSELIDRCKVWLLKLQKRLEKVSKADLPREKKLEEYENIKEKANEVIMAVVMHIFYINSMHRGAIEQIDIAVLLRAQLAIGERFDRLMAEEISNVEEILTSDDLFYTKQQPPQEVKDASPDAPDVSENDKQAVVPAEDSPESEVAPNLE